ncbi:unnamed protein product, partial [Discosporangium mesarthrocarpum]
REGEFTAVSGVNIFCGTWNVNAKKPDVTDPVRRSNDLIKPGAGDEGGERASGAGGRDGNKSGGSGGACDGRQGRVRKRRAGLGDMADIYAVGLQEMVDLNAVNVAIDTKSQ